MVIHDRQGARQEVYKMIQAPTYSSSTEEMRKAIEEDGLEALGFQDKDDTGQS